MQDKDKYPTSKSKPIQVSTSTQYGLMNGIGLSDLEAVRLILSGNSVIDWERANFRTIEEVNCFLRVQRLDWEDEFDRIRIQRLFQSALHFLEEHLQMSPSKQMRETSDIRKVFLWASDYDVESPLQTESCIILKLMHVLQHLDSAELRHQASLAEEQLLAFAEEQVLAIRSQMMQDHPGVLDFYGSRKTRESIIAKLLAKKEDVASTVFDKLRFRIITKEKSDILPLLVWLQRRAFPFNFVIPGQSHNNLVPFLKMVGDHHLSVPPSNGILEKDVVDSPNQFSSASYQVINFIVDIPVKIDAMIEYPFNAEIGRVVFVMAEFQIVDQATSLTNEQGSSSHELYKARQLEKVKSRLRYGEHLPNSE